MEVFTIIAMSFGVIGFIFGLISFVKIQKLTKIIQNSGQLNEQIDKN
jgi:CHASE3 domain sensor protein